MENTTADPKKVLAAWIIEKLAAEADDNFPRVNRAQRFIDRIRAKNPNLPEMDPYDAHCVLTGSPMHDEDGFILD